MIRKKFTQFTDFQLKITNQEAKLESKKREDVYYHALQQLVDNYKNDDSKIREKEQLWISFKSDLALMHNKLQAHKDNLTKFQSRIDQKNGIIHEMNAIIRNIKIIIDRRENNPRTREVQEFSFEHAGIDFFNGFVRSSELFDKNFHYFQYDIHKNSSDFNRHKFTNVESFLSVMNDKKIDKMERTVSFRAMGRENNFNKRSVCITLFDEIYSISVKFKHQIGDLRKTIDFWLDLSS
jgi:hypothetical protein